ncbi:MAG TPA: hypothetical protein VL294_12635 [Pseudolysinimonas sp.]|jgi:hypothetical protein|nr:hypothetical protein [Pseudolysinimonas sp.]
MDQLPNGEWWPDRARLERVAVVTDPKGWTYEVVAENGRIEALTLRPPPGIKVTQRMLSGVPHGYLRDVAASYWRDVDDNLASPPGTVNVTPLTAALDAASGEVGPFVGKPNMQDFARIWNATPARRFNSTTRKWEYRRAVLQTLYRRPNGSSVGPDTISAWTKEARDKKLIPPATTGRGNKASDGKQPSGHRGRKTK